MLPVDPDAAFLVAPKTRADDHRVLRSDHQIAEPREIVKGTDRRPDRADHGPVVGVPASRGTHPASNRRAIIGMAPEAVKASRSQALRWNATRFSLSRASAVHTTCRAPCARWAEPMHNGASIEEGSMTEPTSSFSPPPHPTVRQLLARTACRSMRSPPTSTKRRATGESPGAQRLRLATADRRARSRREFASLKALVIGSSGRR